DVTPSIDAVRSALAARDIEILEALRADGGRYWSYVCQRADCCPPSGTPFDIASTTVAAEATYAGLSPASSRAELAARLAPVNGVSRIAMREAARRADERLCQLLDDAIVERLTGSAGAERASGHVTAVPAEAGHKQALSGSGSGGEPAVPHVGQ